MPAKRKTKRTVRRKVAPKRTTKRKASPKRSYTHARKAPIRIQARKPLPTTRPRGNRGGYRALSIIGLILNLIILPGLGTIVGGRVKEGVWQIVVLLGSILLGLLLNLTIVGAIIGIPIMIIGPIIVWIWSLISGIIMIKESFN